MRCSWMKWKVSQSWDSGKDLPGYVMRHLGRCASCRNFFHVSQTISEAGRQTDFSSPDELNEKVIRKIRQDKIAMAKKKRIPRSIYIGLSAAAAGLLIIILLPIATPFREKREIKDLPQLLKTRSIVNMSNKMMTSPYEREIGFIQNALRSTADKVFSAADPKLSFPPDTGENSLEEM